MFDLRLPQISPLWTFDGDALVSFDLSFTRGMTLQGLDNVCDTDGSLESTSIRLSQILCGIPEGSVVRFYSVCTGSYAQFLDAFQQQFPEGSIGQYVAKKKGLQLRDLARFKRELFCFVSTPSQENFSATNPNALGRKTEAIKKRLENLREVQLKNSQRVLSTLAAELSALGISAKPLEKDAFFNVLYRLSNPTSPIGPPRYAEPVDLDAPSLRSQLFSSGILNHLDYFERGGKFHRVLSMRIAPRSVIPKIITKLQSLSFPHCLAVTLKRIPDEVAEKRISKIRGVSVNMDEAMSKAQGVKSEEMPDFDVQQQKMDANEVLQSLKQGGEKLYEVAIQLWMESSSKDELDDRTLTALTQFRACGEADGAIEEFRSTFAFMSLIPGQHALMGERYHPMLASRAADLMPVFGTWPGSKNPTSVLTARDGTLVGFHPFNPEFTSWNATIAGATGSGKSFVTRCLLNGWVGTGGRVVVVTIGSDYHRFVQIFGGTAHDITLDDPQLALGPFPTAKNMRQSKSPNEILGHLSNVIAIMLCEKGKHLSRLHRHLIFKTTQSLYDDTSCEHPTFVDWLDRLQSIETHSHDDKKLIHEITAQLLFWIDGPYGHAFLRNRSMDPNEKLSVWNLKNIRDDDTRGVVLALLSGIIAQSIEASPTIIVMDEVWSILKGEAGPDLVESLYRTVRKEGSAIWSISQSMSDYAALPAGCRDAILNNSPFKMLLAHEAANIETAASICHLNDREKSLLQSLRTIPGQYSEILCMLSQRRQVLRLIPTPIEYWLATSNKKDVDWEALARSSNPNKSPMDVLKVLAHKYPHGAMHVAA